MTVEEKAKTLGINCNVLIASKEKPYYKMGQLQLDIERFDQSWSGCGAKRQWEPNTTYYVWDLCEEYVRSCGNRRTVTYYNPTNTIVDGAYAKTLSIISIPNTIRNCVVYYTMCNDSFEKKVEFQDEEIQLKLEDIPYYVEPDINPSGFKNLITKKVYPIEKKDKIVFEEEKIADFSVTYTTNAPVADTMEEGFALIGWKPYKYFDNNFEVFKTRYWDGSNYWCGYSVRGHRIKKRYTDMTFSEEISKEEIEIESLEKRWWHSSPMVFEGRLNEEEAQEKYFRILNEKEYPSTTVEDIIKSFYGSGKIERH